MSGLFFSNTMHHLIKGSQRYVTQYDVFSSLSSHKKYFFIFSTRFAVLNMLMCIEKNVQYISYIFQKQNSKTCIN